MESKADFISWLFIVALTLLNRLFPTLLKSYCRSDSTVLLAPPRSRWEIITYDLLLVTFFLLLSIYHLLLIPYYLSLAARQVDLKAQVAMRQKQADTLATQVPLFLYCVYR